jgi:hypothetical protein
MHPPYKWCSVEIGGLFDANAVNTDTIQILAQRISLSETAKLLFVSKSPNSHDLLLTKTPAQSDLTNHQLHDLAGEALQYGLQRKSSLHFRTVLEWKYGLHHAGIVFRAPLSYLDSLSTSFWLYVVFQRIREGLNLAGELFMLNILQIFKFLNPTL